ncbi:MAG TPA: NAD(P)H-dependent glycerol-3-phosphate dehydrogenase [Gaiellales bacterium]|nr:NAD(P)H-dependent glycerol-3-phosphate dehydrogenase [Gaiellales bacterium]
MRAAVVGGGSWGTAFARHLVLAGHETTLVCRDPVQAEEINRRHRNPRYLYDVELPAELRAEGLDAARFDGAELVAVAVPSRGFAATIELIAERLPAGASLLSLTKGLDPTTHRRMSEILAAVGGGRQHVAVLSGPNHSEEVARDSPTASVVASDPIDLARGLQGALSTTRLRVYASGDVVGVELCAAAKNVIGLAAGVSDGLGFGDNAKAAIITRGMAEMSRLGAAFGAQPRTFAGMAGMGDLVATCTSRHSRNRRAGELLARGVPGEWIEREIGQVAEGLTTAPVLRELGRSRGLELPITEAVCEVAAGRMMPLEAVAQLMAREPTEE